MTSTTLMTFLLVLSPHVKSVKLLGSWDNFSKPYYMERDRRIGSGHWRGCHTFTDIICDGSPSHMGPARSGGLKMGGTYWYYYLLDDDVEYYNEAEPVTSQCPFLPGQPVNVLHVPIILPDTTPTHTRERSCSSNKTDQRTMNPEDKYMNPRRPPKPKLPRLRTSPPLLQQPTPAWSFNASPLGLATHKASSQPGSATSNARNRVGSKESNCKAARSVSPPRSRGLRAAFRQWNASSPELSAPSDESTGNIPGFMARGSASSRSEGYEDLSRPRSRGGLKQPTNNTETSRPCMANNPWLPVPTETHDHTPLSIQERRVINATYAEQTPRRNPLTLQTNLGSATPRGQRSPRRYSRTAQGSSVSSYPFLTTATVAMPSELDATTPTPFTFKEKRLPTLPNTPSSVMDEALRDLDDRERALDTENFGSHFSDFSATETSIDSPYEQSRFSEWSTDTELISPESMTSSLTFNNESQTPSIIDRLEVPDLDCAITEPSDPDTPHLTVASKPSPTTLGGDSPRFNLPPPRLTISLSPSDLDVPGLCIHDDDHVETNPKRHAAFFGGMDPVEALGIAKSPEAGNVNFPDSVKNDMFSMIDGRPATAENSHRDSRRATVASQSATMQEMIDELSYLKNMIQSGDTGDI
ncbi:hypothetical protein P170DRAFT_358231 [Aspergillus steynii IBT 23096]|uniref:Uncharacterized protein n=1 Tax=Aspergillus steynii IBT 23096 TaxID=1392250 RepID=A0A2I2G7M8_9EURO|nr:uncharacterized protein P170DRAFT_358231 [Aspergillus steynii IBT 23096]PLB48884.1 hypothetical protein P170DRAFT_358231 [Aspergillus steynii IBT 23096]